MCLCVVMHNSFWENIFFTENNLVYKIQDNSHGNVLLTYRNVKIKAHLPILYNITFLNILINFVRNFEPFTFELP